MFIRKVTTRIVKGKIYSSYRIVENHRLPNGKVKQQTLLNLGSAYSFSEEHWPLLTDRVSNIIMGIELLIPLPSDIEYEAQRLANIIIQKHGQHIPLNPTHEPNYECVDTHSIETSDIKSVGAEFLVHETAKLLNLPEILSSAGFDESETETALASILGRLIAPGSEVATNHYLKEKSALDEVMGVSFSKLNKNKLYAISDKLWAQKSIIEEALYQQEKKLFKFDEIVTLYDLTNTYFEGQSKANENAAHGRSKEKRSDCVLVTLALVLDGSGFPKKSHIFKGNVSESGTLEEMVQMASKDAIIIMDAGIATEDNIQWLVDHEYKYLVISRKRRQCIPEDISGVVVKEYQNNKVTSYLVKSDNDSESELYCHSEAMEEKGNMMQEKFKDRFTSELQKLSDGLTQKRCLKKYDKIYEKIGRLKEKYSKVSGLYEIKIESDDEKQYVTKINWEYQPSRKSKKSGIYCIRTNQTQLNNTEIWDTYRMLNDIESAFRILKTDLGLRPIYHQKTERISGHIFITLLGYHILHTIRYQLKGSGIHDSWLTIMNKLSTHFRVTTSLRRKEKNPVHIRKSIKPNDDQLKIYQACNLKSVPLKTVISEY